jgi:hypothetical protein
MSGTLLIQNFPPQMLRFLVVDRTSQLVNSKVFAEDLIRLTNKVSAKYFNNYV